LFTSSSNVFFGFNTGIDTLSRVSIRGNVAAQFRAEDFNNCRLDQVAAGLVQLLTVDFVVNNMIAAVLPYVMIGVAKVRKMPYKKDEFQVAKKMVNLLYFQGLVFLSMPFAPLFTFVVLMFQFTTFKFEKYTLFKFGTKPKKEWKAQDAGGFFIKFYLITIIVTGMLAVFLFLSGTSFAKDYTIYEEQFDTDTGLATLFRCDEDALTETCTVYTVAQIQDVSRGACGPFVKEVSAWTMIEEDVADNQLSTLGEIAFTVLTQAGIVWFIVLFLFLRLSFTESTLGVVETATGEKDRAFEAANMASDAKVRKMGKKIKMLEAAAKS